MAIGREDGHRGAGRACALFVLLALGISLAAAAAPSLTAKQKTWLSRAWTFKKNGWTYVHIEGGPRERGFQYGYLLAPEIAQAMKGDRVSWEYDTAMPWQWLVKKASAMYEGKAGPEYTDELGGIAEGLSAAGVPATRDQVLTYNAMYELIWYWWPKEKKKLEKGPVIEPRKDACSSFIATGSMTADGGIVLGHNSMQGYAYPLPNVVIDIKPDKGHRILMQTYPGWIHSGTDFFVTDAGIVGSETTIGGFTDYKAGGIPEFVRVRRADAVRRHHTAVVRHHEEGQQRRLRQRLAPGRREHRQDRAAWSWDASTSASRRSRTATSRAPTCPSIPRYSGGKPTRKKRTSASRAWRAACAGTSS